MGLEARVSHASEDKLLRQVLLHIAPRGPYGSLRILTDGSLRAMSSQRDVLANCAAIFYGERKLEFVHYGDPHVCVFPNELISVGSIQPKFSSVRLVERLRRLVHVLAHDLTGIPSKFPVHTTTVQKVSTSMYWYREYHYIRH